ncbi:UDP-N-acetylmuramoyl-L-alanine--D-glutamate ligase [Glycomyces albus]
MDRIADRVLVAGTGIAGAASAEALLDTGRTVVVYDRADSERLRELESRGARVAVAERFDPALLEGVEQVVVSPGFPPDHPLAAAAAERGLETYSEPELAWRLRGPGAARWLAVTGTNGKTTTTTMLAGMLEAGGLRTAALGNIGEPLVHAVNGPYDVLAVELSSQQLHWSRLLAPTAGPCSTSPPTTCPGTAASTPTPMLRPPSGAGSGRVQPRRHGRGRTRRASERPIHRLHPRRTRARPVRRSSGHLVDSSGEEPVRICSADEVHPAGAHNVANALAAAALASHVGVGPDAVARALRDYSPEPHRNVTIATVPTDNGGAVRWVDDSKATNPHAAAAALAAYEPVVWIAGGQLKGVDVSDLVERFAPRMRAAVLIGVDRARIADAFARHAPSVPVVVLHGEDDSVMTDVVDAAAAHARPGDTVLLSPAAASYDMFDSYAHRGRAFAAAIGQTLGMSTAGGDA